MRLKVKRLHPYPHSIYLASFQLLLFGYTISRAGTARNEHLSCWTIQTSSNLRITIFDAEEDNDGEMERDVDPTLWEGKRLPYEAVPTFEACNVARRYELEVSMGFQCRGLKVTMQFDGRFLSSYINNLRVRPVACRSCSSAFR
jgi:hypothetical protein